MWDKPEAKRCEAGAPSADATETSKKVLLELISAWSPAGELSPKRRLPGCGLAAGAG